MKITSSSSSTASKDTLSEKIIGLKSIHSSCMSIPQIFTVRTLSFLFSFSTSDRLDN